MRPSGRRRTYAVVAVSAASHVAVFAALAVYGPRLGPPRPDNGARLQMAPVLLLERPPRPSAEASRPREQIRLHRRPEPLATDIPVAPPAAPASGPTGGVSPPAPQPAAQAVLRKSLVGCANPDAAGLTREEREACEQRFAANAKDAPWTGLGLNADKRRSLDAVEAHKAACRIYRAGGEQPPLRSGVC